VRLELGADLRIGRPEDTGGVRSQQSEAFQGRQRLLDLLYADLRRQYLGDPSRVPAKATGQRQLANRGKVPVSVIGVRGFSERLDALVSPQPTQGYLDRASFGHFTRLIESD